MGLFKDMRQGIAGAKELGDHHGGMPSIGGAFKDLKALSDDRGEGEVHKVGAPAKAVVKGFSMPCPTDRFAMTVDLEIHADGRDPYPVTYTYPTARQKAPMTPGMEIPVKVHPDDPQRIAVQWDALKGSIAASGGDMAAVMGGLQQTYAGTADAAMRQAMAGAPGVPTTMPGGMPAPAAAAATPAVDGPAEKLAKLAKLRDAGVITEEDFNAKKADLLDQL
jgi:hypothetical protein